jgi:glycosyltransferase involved in cell wall biosynthesis
MHIFLNALGASTASGLTYLRNVLPYLASREDVRTTVALSSWLQPEFRRLGDIAFADTPDMPGAAQRFWFEQRQLPALLRQAEVDVLVSTGNFALRKSPVPQILLSGNSLYTSADFYRDLLSRREYRMWLDTRVKAVFAKRSVFWADCTVAPTQAFAGELRRWTGKTVFAVHHGFDCNIFFSDRAPLPAKIQCRLDSAKHDLKLLHVSHYNYFRNFETLLRALPLVREKLAGRKVRLFLTCRFEDGQNPGLYRTRSALRLVEQLGIRDEVVELGTVPYHQLHQLYRACDLYVTASYAETFAHPVVEARACGLRVIASDLPVHHEVCGDSASYFSRFSPEELADQILQAAKHPKIGLHSAPASVPQFFWCEHVDKIVELAATLVRNRCAAGRDNSLTARMSRVTP